MFRGRCVTCCGRTRMIELAGASLHAEPATRLAKTSRKHSVIPTSSSWFAVHISSSWRSWKRCLLLYEAFSNTAKLNFICEISLFNFIGTNTLCPKKTVLHQTRGNNFSVLNWFSKFFDSGKRTKFSTKPCNSCHHTFSVLPHYLPKVRSSNLY